MKLVDIALLAAVAGVVALAVRRLVKNKKQGKTACGCDCGTCTCGCGGKKRAKE